MKANFPSNLIKELLCTLAEDYPETRSSLKTLLIKKGAEVELNKITSLTEQEVIDKIMSGDIITCLDKLSFTELVERYSNHVELNSLTTIINPIHVLKIMHTYDNQIPNSGEL